MSTLLDVTGQEWTKGEEGTRWPLSIHSNALAASLVVKTGPGKLYGFAVYTNNATAQFVLVCDANAVPADGFVPCFPFTVSSSAPLYVSYGDTGRCFDTGIVLCNSSTAVTKTIGAADCWFDAQYVQMPIVTGTTAAPVTLTKAVTLASADLLALGTTPFTLVPGVAGKAIVPIAILTRLHFGTAPYSEAGVGRVFNSASTYGASGWGEILNGGIGITGNVNGATSLGVAFTGDEEPLTLLDGKALRIDETGAVTGGDGTLDVTTLYYLLAVA